MAILGQPNQNGLASSPFASTCRRTTRSCLAGGKNRSCFLVAAGVCPCRFYAFSSHQGTAVSDVNDPEPHYRRGPPTTTRSNHPRTVHANPCPPSRLSNVHECENLLGRSARLRRPGDRRPSDATPIRLRSRHRAVLSPFAASTRHPIQHARDRTCRYEFR